MRLPYLPALDGLRALAVIAVLFYHAGLAWIPGGFLGVEMFFVISGYLITGLLLAEWSKNGRVDLKAFWVRRARRLFPALFLLLVIVVGYTAVFLPTEVAALRGDWLSAAGYVNNWYQILSHKSYFESVGRPPLLRHLWSLAVEEQFYLVWPLAFCVLLRRFRPAVVLALVLAGAFVSMGWMAMLFQPNTDPSRIYYGTDTRAAGLLLGAALAFLWRPGRDSGAAPSRWLDAAGLGALATLGVCFVLIHEFQPFLYQGGFGLTALATAELLAVAVHPRARLLPRVLSWAPLRWVGVRSYGIYLWHFPVFMLTRPQLDVAWDGVGLLAFRFALTLMIAALSYRFVETPIRNGAIGRAIQSWREARGESRRKRAWGLGLAGGSVVGAVALAGVAVLVAEPPAPPAYLTRSAAAQGSLLELSVLSTNATTSIPGFPGLALPAETEMVKLSSWQPPIPTNPPASVAAPHADGTTPVPLTNAQPVTAIGDSVMEGVAEELRTLLGANMILEASQGRLPWDTPGVVRALHAQGRIHPVVILHIGNNGFFSAEMLDQIMAELKEANRVVIVNIKAPRRWESLNNRMLASAVPAYRNAVLVDWHDASSGHPGFFWKDGIHLRPEGARAYARAIAQALRGS